MYSSIPWFFYSCTHLYPDFFIHVPIYTLIFLFMYSSIPWFFYSCTHLYPDFFIHVPIYTLIFLFMYPSILWFFYSCTHLYPDFFIHVPIYTLIFFIHVPIYTLIFDLCTYPYWLIFHKPTNTPIFIFYFFQIMTIKKQKELDPSINDGSDDYVQIIHARILGYDTIVPLKNIKASYYGRW